VVESIQDLFGLGFEETKVDDHPAFIQRLGFHGNLYGEVMAMEGLAFSPYIPKVMSGGKIGFDFNFVHDRNWQPKKEKRLEHSAKRKNEIIEGDAFNLLD
jgi:hypothetical protein